MPDAGHKRHYNPPKVTALRLLRGAAAEAIAVIMRLQNLHQPSATRASGQTATDCGRRACAVLSQNAVMS